MPASELRQMKNCVFDLYGTLVDIHTDEERAALWAAMAEYYAQRGAAYTGEALKARYLALVREREAGLAASDTHEAHPEIRIEEVFLALFTEAGVSVSMDDAADAARRFRELSTDYIRLYPGALEALARLRQKGLRLWLLSNAQRVFTAYELRHLGLGEQLDGIYISSDYGCRKPDERFYQALIEEKGLDVSRCLMIGNDRDTDIAGAKALGMATLYMHTALTPPDQRAADGSAHPNCHTGPHFEYEGDDWADLVELVEKIAL
jgi:putative hydrolase of the HAD superfamily